MLTLARFAGATLVVGAILTIQTSRADSTPPAARFYPFLGRWQGHGQVAVPGQSPAKLMITVSCRKVASGWAVQCATHARNKQMVISESDLMAVNTATGKAHWFGVTNQGQANDYLVFWPDAHTMRAHCAWTQAGKQMQENVVFKFTSSHAVNWRTVDTVDGGQVVSTYSGSVTRR